jgi:hypothetical protein
MTMRLGFLIMQVGRSQQRATVRLYMLCSFPSMRRFLTIIHTYGQSLSLNPSWHLSGFAFTGLFPFHLPHVSSNATGCKEIISVSFFIQSQGNSNAYRKLRWAGREHVSYLSAMLALTLAHEPEVP